MRKDEKMRKTKRAAFDPDRPKMLEKFKPCLDWVYSVQNGDEKYPL